MFFTRVHQLKKGEYLYKKGDKNGLGFFFIMKGRIELLVMPADKESAADKFNEDDLKFSKHVETGQYFSFRSSGFNDPRNDYARI